MRIDTKFFLGGGSKKEDRKYITDKKTSTVWDELVKEVRRIKNASISCYLSFVIREYPSL